MINTEGYFNNKHRIWAFNNILIIKQCLICFKKNKDDAILEMFLRFKMNQLLRIENDNFTQKFQEYNGIEFIFNIPKIFRKEKYINYEKLIEYIIEQKMILGVGFRINNSDNKNITNSFTKNINIFTSYNFVIPILAFGKMWEIIFNTVTTTTNNNIVINKNIWNNFEYNGLRNKCLLCNNFPFGIYPGNFIVNQNILYMRGFIWMDKKKFHVQKNPAKEIIAYNDNSVIITWPFLKDHIDLSKRINHLGNMVCFTSGDIFPSYIDSTIKKICKISLQNDLIQKAKKPLELTVEDLKLMYKHCRRKKKYCIKTFQKTNINDDDDDDDDNEIEKKIIFTINNPDKIQKLSLTAITTWFKYPKSKTNVGIIIQEISQMIKRGEIDSAITQTSILNKDYSNINNNNNNNNNNNLFNKTNLDVHRIGRYTRNVATNDFWNICAIGNGIQKVLPKDSKTKEPKKITKSEIGFLDPINTPDTPRHCGLILESVLDVIVSTYSMTCPSIEEAFMTIFSEEFEKLDNVVNISTLNSSYIYVSANFELYRFKPTIPNCSYMNKDHYVYIAKHYGIKNYFRLTQYALKIKYPCIELIKESEQFWICTSQPRTFYKIHVDGLLYTAREMEYFERDNDNNNNIWIGKERQNICNIFGPSIRGTPRPNTSHLPRISHAISSSWKHAIGVPTNTHQQSGSIHQKNVTISYYCLKLNEKDNILLPGFPMMVLVMSGFNNQEDGIAVRKSVIDRGMFLATSYETATVRISYSIFQSSSSICKIKFIPTIKKNQILRKGLQVGYFRNKTEEELEIEEEEEEEEKEENENNNTKIINKDRLIDIFSPELKLMRYDLTTMGITSNISNEKNECLAVIWNGKNDDDDDNDNDDDDDDDNNNNDNDNVKKKTTYKCHELKCNDIKCMKHLKMYLIYYSQFTPTVGDKLHTSTSQKGVITELISDEDTPYVVIKTDNKIENILPDIIVNPQYLKRQTFDNIFNTGEMLSQREKTQKNPFLENCFNYQIGDSIYHIELGSKLLTGKVMNPITGYPYMRPITTTSNTKIYNKPFYEYIGEDGFTYVTKYNNNNNYEDKFEIIEGSIYISHYFNVCNHRATHMMQSSKCDKNITRTEFSGTPIRGKKGGFSTGPQEQSTLIGLGMTRFGREVSLIRSDYCNVLMKPKKKKNEEEEIFGGSTTFKRMHDDLDMRDLNVTYKVKKLYT